MTGASKRPAVNTRTHLNLLLPEVFTFDGRPVADEQGVAFPEFAIQRAVRIIDGDPDGAANIAAMVVGWAAEDRGHSQAGRPAFVSLRSFLILSLMHTISGEDTSLPQMAHTLAVRLDRDQFDRIDLANDAADSDVWYVRLHWARQTLLRLVDPQQPHATDADVARRQSRIDDLMSGIVANSALLSDHFARDYVGDASLESVFIPTHETASKAPTVHGQSRTHTAGPYCRHQNNDHATQPKKHPVKGSSAQLGFEADLLMVPLGNPNHGQALVLGLSLHRPGHLASTATTLLSRYAKLGLPSRTLRIDEPLTHIRVEYFHEVVQRHQWALVWEYRPDDLGIQHRYTTGPTRTTGTRGGSPVKGGDVILVEGTWHRPDMPAGLNDAVKLDQPDTNDVIFVEGTWHRADMPAGLIDAVKSRLDTNDVILVDGTWYLSFMPAGLIDAVKLSQLDTSDPRWIDRDQLATRLEQRKNYQLSPVGPANKNGKQRYRLPDPDGYIAINPITNEPLDKPRAKSVTIPVSEGLRWRQPFPYLSPQWQAANRHPYSTDSNRDGNSADLAWDVALAIQPRRRGYADTGIALAMAVAAQNLRAIDRNEVAL